MSKRFGKFLSVAVIPVMFMGCVPVQSQHNGPTPMNVTPQRGYMAQQGQIMQPQQEPVIYQQQYLQPQVSSEFNSLKERVRRVERAMIRLDRRMQLLERNELARISSSSLSGEGTQDTQGMFKPMSYKDPQTQTNQHYKRSGYTPVSVNDSMVTSTLQVAPKRQVRPQRNTFSNMPSLADEKNGKNDDTGSVSIWTIGYDSSKIWPNRAQLTYSRDVVDALRSGKRVTLFARGSNPSSREFRERVRAVSKYLSKVSGVEDVPIASMPAKHLDSDTIEVLATR